MRLFRLSPVCALILLATSSAHGAPAVYWTTWTSFREGRVYRSDLDGQNQQLLFTNSSARYTTGLQVDALNGIAYVGEFGATSGGGARIWKMSLDGSAASVLATTSRDSVWNLALDHANQTLYFNSSGSAASPLLGRVNTDGSGLSYFGPNGSYGEALDLDPVRGELFFQDNSDAIVRRISTSGGTPTVAFYHSTVFPSLELDPANARLFLPAGNLVRQANYDGTGIINFTAAPRSLWSLEHVPAEGKVYFSSHGGDFGYVDLFNPNAPTPLFESNMFMYAIDVVVPEPSALGLLLFPLLLQRRRSGTAKRDG